MPHRRLALLCVAFLLSDLAAQQKPNVLFIAIDDQNDWIGYLGGHHLAKTPHIDRLAQRGTAFTNAHCQAPICNPSRTSLMTGLRPSSTGIYGLAPWFRNLPEFKDRVSLPQYFRQHGYRTLSTGKIYHGGYGRRPRDREFEVLGPAASPRPFPKQKLVTTPGGNHRLVDWGLFPHADTDKGDHKIADWAVSQLDARPEEPFFLSVGFFLPHVPCYATRRWFDLYPDDDSVLPPVLLGDRDDTPRFSWYLHWRLPEVRRDFLEAEGEWRKLVRSYLACTSFVDHQVGRVLDALKRNGLADNTIVVLWSDHGWHLGEKRITGKNTLWDDSTRVPLIFAGPGIKPGQTCHKPAELLDIYPSLNALCGLPARDDQEGHSLVPQLRDAKADRPWPAITTHNHDNHGVRSERWRYIRYADGSEELYDMRRDPHEWHNLAGKPEHAAVLAAHRKHLPKVNRKPAQGSRARILVHDKDKTVWQRQEIPKGAAIPDLLEAKQLTHRRKRLPIPGQSFVLQGRTAFLIRPDARSDQPTPWVLYAPTLPRLPGRHETWMFERFLSQGIAIAGIDVGESYGSPAGRALYSALHTHLVQTQGMARKPVLLARSRGGLMLYNWAAEHPDLVAGIAGIYPVCNLLSYPGLERAHQAYGMSEAELRAQLQQHNPIDRLAPLAGAEVPILHIHGDQDRVVPLDANSALLVERYRRLGGAIRLETVPGRGHDLWEGWFKSQALVDFVVRHGR